MARCYFPEKKNFPNGYFFFVSHVILDLPSNTLPLYLCVFFSLEFPFFRSIEPHSVLQLLSLIYLILREMIKTCDEDFILDPCCLLYVYCIIVQRLKKKNQGCDQCLLLKRSLQLWIMLCMCLFSLIFLLHCFRLLAKSNL
jgi:hypothetical protein